jgi:hypothetical protein
MVKRVLGYGHEAPRTDRWFEFHGMRAVIAAGALPAILIAAWAIHEVRFYWLTDPTYLRGKTVAQIVGSLGLPDEDHRDADEAVITAATRPLYLSHTYGPHECFDGDFVYLDPYGLDFCRIDIRNGVATQVVRERDMK